MSIGKFIPIEVPIQYVMEDTSEEHAPMKFIMVRWAVNAIGRLNSLANYERKAFVRTVTDCIVELPTYAVHVNALIYGDQGTDCPILNDCKYYRETTIQYDGVDTIFRWDNLEGGTCYQTPYPWSIRNNKIVIDCDVNGDEVTLDLLVHPTDADGLPLMLQEHTDMVVAYLKMKLAEKEQWTRYRKGKMQRIDIDFIDGLGMRFERERKIAKSKGQHTSEMDKEAISQMIYHPLTGRGYLNLVPL